MSQLAETTLLLESPAFVCGRCRFMSRISGHWYVENGRLVFRVDEIPQARRGPDLEECCEGPDCGGFSSIVADSNEHQVINGAELETLRSTARRFSEKKHDERKSCQQT